MSRGSFLKKNQAAFIIDDAGEIELRLPKMEPDAIVPRQHMVILALAKLSMDPSWIEEMIEMIEMAHEQATSKPAPKSRPSLTLVKGHQNQAAKK